MTFLALLLTAAAALFGAAMYPLGRHDGYGKGYDAGVTDGWAKLPRKPKPQTWETGDMTDAQRRKLVIAAAAGEITAEAIGAAIETNLRYTLNNIDGTYTDGVPTYFNDDPDYWLDFARQYDKNRKSTDGRLEI